MVIAHGDVVWVDFGSPRGSEPAKRRPAIVMQEDWLLATEMTTVLVVPLTSNVALEAFPGNVLIPVDASGLGKDSVAVVSQVGPVSREFLEPYPTGHLPNYVLSKIADGIRLVLGI
ncbi:type II toxin-antitoxin system PemK/MazF family toxin [Agromyces sp. NPDC058484]|uniref:type II toxin-antitoxin system PemK/MazF family toxin n=1 Tax=Agromyces sp. NPDC058484 TaxID=3346524 RepID=UPI00366891D5